ncbi:MAG TPA: hypothetical protein VGE72_30205 [Azospirillum sp.]
MGTTRDPYPSLAPYADDLRALERRMVAGYVDTMDTAAKAGRSRERCIDDLCTLLEQGFVQLEMRRGSTDGEGTFRIGLTATGRLALGATMLAAVFGGRP